MINIDYLGNTHSVILRPRQISSLSSPKWLFELYNKNTKTSILFIVPDISLNEGSYSEYELRNVASGATGGSFIGDPGEYLVTIRDTEYNNPTIASASSILTTDTMRIWGTASPTIITATQSNTYIYYK